MQKRTNSTQASQISMLLKMHSKAKKAAIKKRFKQYQKKQDVDMQQRIRKMLGTTKYFLKDRFQGNNNN